MKISSDFPCGFCGGPSSNDTCRIQKKSNKADSTCPSAYAFLISAASKFSDNRPCTNIPIPCTLGCNETHWKYNFPQHLETRHPSWRALNTSSVIPASFLSDIEVSNLEQIALGIPSMKTVVWPDPKVVTATLPAGPAQAIPRGQKRNSDWLQKSPSRREKENDDAREHRTPKTTRLAYSGPLDDVFNVS